MQRIKSLILGGFFVVLVSVSGRSQDLSDGDFDCVMDPAEKVQVGSPVTGLLDLVAVKRGDRVRRGQLIARVNSSIEKATVELLKTRASSTAAVDAQVARLKFLTKRHKRTKALLRRKVVSEASMEEVAAELVASQSLLNQARIDRVIAAKELSRAKTALRMREIRSPIDGIVAARSLSAGEFIIQEGHVVSLVQLNPLHVETFLPVRYYLEIKVGAKARVRPAQPVTGEFEATVLVVDRVFDAASGTFGVLLELPNPGGTLPAGHRCKLTFDQVGVRRAAPRVGVR